MPAFDRRIILIVGAAVMALALVLLFRKQRAQQVAAGAVSGGRQKRVRFNERVEYFSDPTQTKLDRKNPHYRSDLQRNMMAAAAQKASHIYIG